MTRVITRVQFIEPQLPSLVDEPPEGKNWIHEVKHDGYRSLVVIDNGAARVFTRNGHDWSDSYPGIVRAALNLPCRNVILDGEAIVQNEKGASDFEALQSAIRWRPYSIILYAFDLLHLDGKDLRHKPLSERRAALRQLVGDDAESRIQLSEEYTGSSAAFFEACAKQGLEGIVSKHVTATYRSGRTKTWLETKCFTESTFVVVGTDRDRKTGALRALLARNDGSGLNYAGAAFIALGGEERAEFLSEIKRLTAAWASFKSSRVDDVTWCEPKLAVEVKHLIGGKFLRHASVKRLVP
jgi:DNA ligase D-like protein (predicted ligase)